MDYGFVRTAAAVPVLRVADCAYNRAAIAGAMNMAEKENVQVMVFPELCMTGYTCGDLFLQKTLLDGAERSLSLLLDETRNCRILAAAGIPVNADGQLFNCAAVFQAGRVLGVIPKTYIPNYGEFYEERWFSPGTNTQSRMISLCGQEVPFGTDILFKARNRNGTCIGVEICEDLWTPVPPSSYQAMAGATLILNLSASDELIGKHEYRRRLISQQSARCIAGYIYSSSGVHESTTDVVYGGHAVISEYGVILAESQRFSRETQLIISDMDIDKLQNDRLRNNNFIEGAAGRNGRGNTGAAAAAGEPDRFGSRLVPFELADISSDFLKRTVDPYPFVPSDAGMRDERCGEIFAIQTAGLGKRMEHACLKHACISISGGLDSTLALLVTARTFDMLSLPRNNIHAITMPGFGTTGATYENALQLMRAMKTDVCDIDIKPACLQHFRDIDHDASVHDVTYENVQARERTQVLMDMANKLGGLAVGTGDLSELALGWCTYNGDHMSMYSVNCGIPKTLVRYLVQWVADNVADPDTKDVLRKVLDTPISPELLPPDPSGAIGQKTEDIIGPYELHDFFLYHMARYGAPPKKILYLASIAFAGSYDAGTIGKWLTVFYKRFFSQQYKRSCLPDGPKVGTISLSPRGDWRMPSDAQAALWLEELES